MALAAAVVLPRHARGYCRSTTVALASPADDPTSSGQCWMHGQPLAWLSGQSIPYLVAAGASGASNQVTFADASRIAELSFETWNRAACAKGPLGVQAYDNGGVDAAQVAVDCGLTQCGPTVHDLQHVITFRDTNWSHSDPNNTIALTTVTFGQQSGTIFDADVEINSQHFQLTTSEPPALGQIDLQSVLTHEAGHFLGLAHATEPQTVMYANYQAGTIALSHDDLNGICAVYPPTPRGGCACDSARVPGGRGIATCSAVAGFAFAFARRRRRKAQAATRLQ